MDKSNDHWHIETRPWPTPTSASARVWTGAALLTVAAFVGSSDGLNDPASAPFTTLLASLGLAQLIAGNIAIGIRVSAGQRHGPGPSEQ